jgi:glutamate-5-semialdehyde dehydrogenase
MTRTITNESTDHAHTGTRELLERTKAAFYRMSALPLETRNRALAALASTVHERQDFWLDQNSRDLEDWKGKLSPSLYARLRLDESKVGQVVQGIRDIVSLPDPIGRVLDRTILDDGLVLEKVSVPLGVIAMVFESRPDVLPQILSLALKSGNAVVLKGGWETRNSNRAFMKIVADVAAKVPELPDGWAQLVDTREDFHELLKYPEYVDLVIPRGSNELVRQIQQSTQIPVLGHADGICHVYVHARADMEKAVRVAIDSKTQYPAVCNAAETLLVDRGIARAFLPAFGRAARSKDVDLVGCGETREILTDVRAATEEDWRAEYLDTTLAVRVVDGLDAAVEHINTYGSHHTDSIITEDAVAREAFIQRVDSATVMANASTRFADGYRFGLGAEVGISTLKTHARGPVGLEGLTIYKYVLRGEGQVVADYVGKNARAFQHRKPGI